MDLEAQFNPERGEIELFNFRTVMGDFSWWGK